MVVNPGNGGQPDNQLVLTGQLLKSAEVRTTPAGIPIARFVIAHQSRRSEAGQVRDVECRMSVVASGQALSAAVRQQPPGTWLKVTGFLSRAGYRAPDLRVALHALKIETVEIPVE
ncbi:MAG TPA: primosomal replication protein N [Gammaproteobacteria bacterium]|nr:primosomal replication protein N [Gammaproteobacteria bacterium]